MTHKISSMIPVVFLTCVLLFTVLNPARLPSAILILPFALFFWLLYLIIIELVSRPRPYAFAVRRRQVVFIAAFPVVLLVLESLGQLSVWDALMVMIIFGGAYFYIGGSSTITLHD